MLDWFEALPSGEMDRAFWLDLFEAPDVVQGKPALIAAIRDVVQTANVQGRKPVRTTAPGEQAQAQADGDEPSCGRATLHRPPGGSLCRFFGP